VVEERESATIEADEALQVRQKVTRKDQSAKQASKKTLEDYQYLMGSARHAADYENTAAFDEPYHEDPLMFGNDAATALEELKPFDLTPYKPRLRYSQEKNEDAVKRKTRMPSSQRTSNSKWSLQETTKPTRRGDRR
jgi:hypothetical protein